MKLLKTPLIKLTRAQALPQLTHLKFVDSLTLHRSLPQSLSLVTHPALDAGSSPTVAGSIEMTLYEVAA